ncbi:hypothetical protein INT47_007109 [Mucor saturninus]|uniref:Uncharacterized protein n=1 Tax=Mucor saturninus TaxID=64648 RepID=A0A8H7UTC4_9FUNG|nr:hypothetical protein INT47_007109 [Mucor saturninus]
MRIPFIEFLKKMFNEVQIEVIQNGLKLTTPSPQQQVCYKDQLYCHIYIPYLLTHYLKNYEQQLVLTPQT